MKKIEFKEGKLVQSGFVEIDGRIYNISEAEYTGETPLSPENLNTMQENIEEGIEEAKKESDTKIKKTKDDFTTHKYRVIVDEIILANTEYTLPCEYIVGNDSLTIFYCNERLICEEEGKDGNYCEVGEKGNKSNKVKFGWDIKVGRIFDFVIKGVVANV